jgi:hypothetical protein
VKLDSVQTRRLKSELGMFYSEQEMLKNDQEKLASYSEQSCLCSDLSWTEEAGRRESEAASGRSWAASR